MQQRKLVNSKNPAQVGEVLTRVRNSVFTVCISRSLQNGYTFKEMSQSHLKPLQKFLDKAVGTPISQVDKNWLRPPDTNDTIDGQQIQHYEVTDSFRIHGFFEDGLFHLIRIDPEHNFHR